VTIGAGGTIIIGVAVGTVAAYAFDWAYDKWGRDLVNNVVDIGKNVAEDIGNAVTGFFGDLKSVFS